MQARPKIVKILVVALLVSLILAACGGGSTGKTWFNLPSAKVHIQPDGAMRVWGFNVGYFPQPALIQQLQAANIQQLEVRTGYNGIHVYANGEDLPYIKWDETSLQTLQEVLPQLPGVPNADTIASALPWLRTIGLGVLLDMPLAQGTSDLAIPKWSGETNFTTTTPTQTVLGPLVIGSLTFDPQGQAIIEGVPASTLEKALGMPIPLALDANMLSILQGLGVQAMQVKVQPNGIDLSLDDRPLPSIAWDEQRLNSLLTYAPAFVADPAQVATLNQVVPLLNAADVTVAVSFTGEQAVDTVLPPIEISMTPEGDLMLAGIPVAQGAIPADTIANLQAANVQQFALSVQPTGLSLAANGQTLPTVTWTEESLATLVNVIGPMAGGTDLLNNLLPIVLGLGPNVKVNVPLAEGATAVEIPAEVTFAVQPVEANPLAPIIRVNTAVDVAGNLVMLGGFSAEELATLGITLPTLPADSLTALRAGGVEQLQLNTEPGILHLQFDGSEALALNYDEPSITTALDIVTPFLKDSPLATPVINQLLREQFVPLMLTSNVNIAIDLE